MNSKFREVFALLVLALMLGCGSGGPAVIPTTPVTGKVTYKGAPVTGAFVSFSPTTSAAGHYVALGMTNGEGVFELHTPFGGETDNPGAVADEYNVTISKSSSSAASAPSDKPPTPAEMAKMAARPARGADSSESGIPSHYANSSSTTIRVNVPGGEYDFDLTDKKK